MTIVASQCRTTVDRMWQRSFLPLSHNSDARPTNAALFVLRNKNQRNNSCSTLATFLSLFFFSGANKQQQYDSRDATRSDVTPQRKTCSARFPWKHKNNGSTTSVISEAQASATDSATKNNELAFLLSNNSFLLFSPQANERQGKTLSVFTFISRFKCVGV